MKTARHPAPFRCLILTAPAIAVISPAGLCWHHGWNDQYGGLDAIYGTNLAEKHPDKVEALAQRMKELDAEIAKGVRPRGQWQN